MGRSYQRNLIGRVFCVEIGWDSHVCVTYYLCLMHVEKELDLIDTRQKIIKFVRARGPKPLRNFYPKKKKNLRNVYQY